MMVTLTQLPIDLATDILSRLPTKTVCCLKIICKSWFNYISDDEFANCLVDRSLAIKTNLRCVVSTPIFDFQEYNDPVKPSKKICPALYSADFGSFDNPIELSHPFKNCKTPVGVIGSCRGLLLLRVNDGHLLLYNPTTQTYNELPFLPVSDESEARFVFGFGYDNVSRDFKCVRIMQILSKETGVVECEVMVYSLNGNCWKRVVDVPCYFKPCYWGIGAFEHEVIHWVGTNIDGVFDFIVTFSVRDDKFSCLSLPSFPVTRDDYLYVGNLDGCLCLLANTFLECNVWIMKEYGVAESWTKMFSFLKYKWESFVWPLSFSMERKKLFVVTSSQKLAYMDLEKREINDVMFTNCDRSLGAIVCVENLLKLDCAEGIRIQKHGKGKNKKKNRRSNY